jgi:ketosteroid isomerase-like protein
MIKISIIARIAALFIVVAIISSCNCKLDHAEKAPQMLVSVDSLDNAWNTAWNSHNVPAISDLFAEDAILVAGDWKVTGKDSLTKQWIKTSIPGIANLKLLPYSQSANPTMAYSSGAYTHDVKENDSITSTQRGVYTIVWEAQANNKWKVSLVQIEVIAEN